MDMSIKPLIDVVRFLESKGIATGPILVGHSEHDTVSPDELKNEDNVIAWSKFVGVLNRSAQHLKTNDDIRELATFTLSDRGAVLPLVGRLMRSVSTPSILYHVFVNMAVRRVIPLSEMAVDTTGPQFRVSARLPDDSPACDLYFRILRHHLEILPGLIGLSRAVVTAEISGYYASYTITPPPGGGPLLRFWRRVRAVLFTNAIIQEMVALEVSVQRKHDALSKAKLQLERSLDEQTLQIRAVNSALEQKISELSQIEELSESGTWTIDSKKKTVRLSSNAARILGLPTAPEEISHDEFVMAIHPDDRKEYRIALARLSVDKPIFYIEHRVLREGEIRIIQQKGKLVAKEKERTVIGSVIDMTNIKANEIRLTQEKESALEASHNKSLFLAGMSHEIRTPMTSVLGFAELIINPKTPPEKINPYVETILRNGRHLLVLIDDILDLSKVEAGHLRFNVSRHKTKELITTTLENIRSQALKKSIDIDLDFHGGLPEDLITDATRVGQIINNVLGNAIKFTDQGTIKVDVCAVDQHNESNSIRIVVEDKGQGVSPEFSRLLFHPYSAFDKEKKRGKTSTGLGLALARALSVAMGGDIKLLSAVETVGCKFEIIVRPMTESADEMSAPLESYSIPINMLGDGPLLKNKNILIVEDNRDIQEILAKTVRDAGADIDLAGNGIECLKKVEQSKFDLVLMDLQMPVMDGFETIERLRSSGFKRPIIVVTAYALNNERERCLKIGATDFVTKPINSDLLLKTLVRHRN